MEGTVTKQIIFTARRIQLCIGQRLSAFGITAAEEPFFMAAQRNAGASQEELSEIVGVDKAAGTRAIRSLESKGYLIRKRNESDRRQNRVYPTDMALKIGDALHNELLSLNSEIINGLSHDKTLLLSEMLNVIEKNLETIREERH